MGLCADDTFVSPTSPAFESIMHRPVVLESTNFSFSFLGNLSMVHLVLSPLCKAPHSLAQEIF